MAQERVLIVEDDLITARHVQDCLQALGYSVTAVAVSGPEAIDKAAETRPDVVLMDIRLEGVMDGVEAAGQIGSRLDIPVVYLTAYADENTLHGAEITEPYGYILKPFEERDLRVTISMALYNHRMKQELRKSEERYRHLFESVPDPVTLFDAETRRFVDVNEAGLRLYGYDRDEFLELTQGDITAEPEESEDSIERTLAGELTHIPLRYHKKKDGSVFPVEISASSFPAGDRQVMCGIVKDITERVQAESQMDAALENVRDNTERLLRAQRVAKMGFLDWNLKTNEMIWSDQVYDIFGIDMQVEKSNIDLTLQLVHPDDKELVDRNLEMAIRDEKEYDIDHRKIRPDGQIIWVHSQAELTRDADGNPENLLGTVVDITERKRAQSQRDASLEALAAERNLLRTLIDTIPDFIFVKDRESRFLVGNIAMARLVGTPTPDDLLAKRDTDFYSEEMAARYYADDQEVMTTGQPLIGHEEPGADREGNRRWLSTSKAPLRDAAGEVVGVVGIGRDITERVQAESQRDASQEALRRSRDEWTSTFDAMSDWVSLLDLEARILRTNAAGEDLAGVPLAEMVGQTCCKLVHGTDEPIPGCPFQKMLRTHQRETVELQPLDGDRWLMITVDPVMDDDGKLIRAVHIVRDVTERKRVESQRDASLEALRDSEERYRAIFEQAADSIVLIDPKTAELVEFNRMAHENLGYTAEEFGKLSVSDLDVIESGEEVLKHAEETVKEGTDVFETKQRTKGGDVLDYRVSARSVTIGGRDVIQSIWYDITDRKQADEELQRYAGRLRQLSRQAVSAQEGERHRVSRELHDETGQALTALKISLELLQSDLPPEAESLRQRLGAAVALTEETMEQMRLLAQDLRPPALDTVGLNATLEGLCRDFAQRTQLAVDYDGAQLPPLPETADICLYRVLQEALTNVVRHANAGHVRVALGCDAEGVSLLVEDDGQGMDEGATVLPGIGLLGMQERMEMLDGQLKIESPPGGGTRLRASIPLNRTGAEGRKGDDTRSPG